MISTDETISLLLHNQLQIMRALRRVTLHLHDTPDEKLWIQIDFTARRLGVKPIFPGGKDEGGGNV